MLFDLFINFIHLISNWIMDKKNHPHFLACWGPCRSFYNSSLRMLLVLFWASMLLRWFCLSCSCCSLSAIYISLILASSSLTWDSRSLVVVLSVLILFSISFLFCSACRARLMPKAMEDSYRVWYAWIVWITSSLRIGFHLSLSQARALFLRNWWWSDG